MGWGKAVSGMGWVGRVVGAEGVPRWTRNGGAEVDAERGGCGHREVCPSVYVLGVPPALQKKTKGKYHIHNSQHHDDYMYVCGAFVTFKDNSERDYSKWFSSSS